MTITVDPVTPVRAPLAQPPRKPPGNPVAALSNTVSATARPWWADGFSVAATCAKVLFFPLKLVSQIAQTAVELAFVAVFVAFGLWYLGYIPDEQVARILGELGNRGLGIIQASGIL
jgi:hypothetical protein